MNELIPRLEDAVINGQGVVLMPVSKIVGDLVPDVGGCNGIAVIRPRDITNRKRVPQRLVYGLANQLRVARDVIGSRPPYHCLACDATVTTAIGWLDKLGLWNPRDKVKAPRLGKENRANLIFSPLVQ